MSYRNQYRRTRWIDGRGLKTSAGLPSYPFNLLLIELGTESYRMTKEPGRFVYRHQHKQPSTSTAGTTDATEQQGNPPKTQERGNKQD